MVQLLRTQVNRIRDALWEERTLTSEQRHWLRLIALTRPLANPRHFQLKLLERELSDRLPRVGSGLTPLPSVLSAGAAAPSSGAGGGQASPSVTARLATRPGSGPVPDSKQNIHLSVPTPTSAAKSAAAASSRAVVVSSFADFLSLTLTTFFASHSLLCFALLRLWAMFGIDRRYVCHLLFCGGFPRAMLALTSCELCFCVVAES
jgi:hypothetical protein